MANLLADMAIECEAATMLAMRMAKAQDDDCPHLARIGPCKTDHFPCRGLWMHVLNELHRELPHLRRSRTLTKTAPVPSCCAGIPVAKYWNTKRAPHFVYECMEAFGGNGTSYPFMQAHFRTLPIRVVFSVHEWLLICIDLGRLICKLKMVIL